MNTQAEALPSQVRRRKQYRRFGPHRMRMAFRHWRRSRPFWGGLLTILGGLIISAGPASAFKVIALAGTVVWEGLLVGVLITVLGLFLWFQPSMRHLYGVLAVILSVLSFITSDLGGFLVGMLLGMTGGALGFSWVPVATWKPAVWRRRARREWMESRLIATVGTPVVALAGADFPVPGVPVGQEVGVVEAVGAEVERLPATEAGVENETHATSTHARRRFPFGGSRG